jgi:uncharacterized protein YsxB (DUF464 family)
MALKKKSDVEKKNPHDESYMLAMNALAKSLNKLSPDLQKFVVCSGVSIKGAHVLNMFSLCMQAENFKRRKRDNIQLTESQKKDDDYLTLTIIDLILGADTTLN